MRKPNRFQGIVNINLSKAVAKENKNGKIFSRSDLSRIFINRDNTK